MVSITARGVTGNVLRIPRTAFESRGNEWLRSEGGPIRLGAETCDVVATSDSVDARFAVKTVDRLQGMVGVPVIAVGGRLVWLVSPGTIRSWRLHPSALCLGGGVVLAIPPRDRRAGPGPHWLSGPRTHFADPNLLWRVLMRYRPALSPQHASLLSPDQQ